MGNTEVFSESEAAMLEKRLEKLYERFPQISIAFCAVSLGGDVNLKEFGFWLLNAAKKGPDEDLSSRLWTLLVIWDGANKRLGATMGYSLEVFLTNSELDKALDEGFNTLREGKVAKAVEVIYRDFNEVLEGAWARADQRLATARERKEGVA